MNEELRSSGEELETSKEELQSINEELRSVNQELKLKVEETTITSANFQNLINSVDIGTIFLDRTFKVAFFTPPARDLFNLLPADYGRPLSDITSKLEQYEIIGDAELVLEKLQPIEREVTTKDHRVFMMRILPYRTAEDRINGVVVTFINITNAKRAEAALRISEERLRITLESAEMGVWDYAVARDTVTWNPQHYRMLGLEPADTVNPVSYFMEFVHPEDKTYVTGKLKSTVEREDIFEVEFRIIRADNKKIRWVNGYGRALQRDQESGRATSVVGVMYDITEKKKLEQQKDEFIGIASHELKTPITSIKGYAQIMQHRFEQAGDPESGQLMQKLNNQVDRLINLVNDLLDTTKIVEGKLSLVLSEFDLNSLIHERIEDLQKISDIHTIRFESDGPATLYADRERIEQVLNNLITNAIKYSPDGGEVTIKTDATDDGVTVSIADTGIGIPAEDIPRVFERFFRVISPETQALPGMGLGLYVSAGIIHRHSGTIHVKSARGYGSTFQFTLPYKSPNPDPIIP